MKNHQKFIVRDGKVVTREYLFKKKEEFHKKQAKLSFEEKIKILVKLQEIARSVRKSKTKNQFVWNITN